jgi:hypothetical protein
VLLPTKVAAEMAQLALHIQQPNLELQTQAAAVAVLRIQIKLPALAVPAS